MLERLHAAGADVPEPYELAGTTIFMEFIGNPEGAAPMLREVRLKPAEARAALSQILRGVRCFLGSDVVHGDLSPYNFLWWNGRARIIDLSQAVQPVENADAFWLPQRDLSNIAGHFAPLGIELDAGAHARELWRSYLANRL